MSFILSSVEIHANDASHSYLYVLSAAKTTINVLSLGGVGEAQVVQALDISAASQGSVAISATNLQGMAFYAKH